MASYEQVIKFENDAPKGVVRLVESNGFYRAYNHSAFLFHQVIAQHKVTRKFVKNLNQDIVYVGLIKDKLLERIGARNHRKTEIGSVVELTPDELLDDAHYEEWRKAIPAEVASRGDVNSLSPRGDELFRVVCERIRVYPMEAKTLIERVGAFVKPFRTYVAARLLRRIRSHAHSITPRMNMRRAQAVVNSSLGVLSHYASYNMRKVFTEKSQPLRYGAISEAYLRFYPNTLD